MSNGYHHFSVDCEKEIGTIKALNGVNLGPIVMNGFMDLSEWMRPLRFPRSRMTSGILLTWPGEPGSRSS